MDTHTSPFVVMYSTEADSTEMMSSDNGTPPIGAIIYGACIVLGCLFLLTMITLRACLYCARRDQQRWEAQETKMQQAIRLQAPAAPPKFSTTITESNTSSMNSMETPKSVDEESSTPGSETASSQSHVIDVDVVEYSGHSH